jgi:hypothetical protein
MDAYIRASLVVIDVSLVRQKYVCKRACLLSRAHSGGGKVETLRAFCTANAFVCVTLQERKRAHLNMVSVRDWLQRSSFVDLLEVGMG